MLRLIILPKSITKSPTEEACKKSNTEQLEKMEIIKVLEDRIEFDEKIWWE
uniref:Uncharacterized protein n=1 Tax=Pithovirus LCPAC403 TaxID=2506596 RepID=A0A481ZAF5_9VIRU|nr:MAG: hypothetical protein LCPAC403_00370 [Pithovirus LCPAC403]